MAVLQMVAVPFPPFLTPPGHPGGGGEREIQTANQYSSPETQPLNRRVGWGHILYFFVLKKKTRTDKDRQSYIEDKNFKRMYRCFHFKI